ncbi:MAG: bifunctional fucokinase/L-fucose-1-P-guanylyltransferase [Prevotella sp.]|nr:bifunctional fucokinase/L-fucose-1-P-guanylyltransferase [Prevotella sp.]
MKKLLSLPPNLVDCFHDITGYSHDEWFCTNDPIGHKLGSGGGTTWLLQRAYPQPLPKGGESQGAGDDPSADSSFREWLSKEKRILLHAGGQSRRLPAYAPSGKILTPIPVFRWERGQRLSQDLLSLQIPLYEHIMKAAPTHLHTMVVSGDVYIRSTELSAIGPQLSGLDADVVCYGLWLDSAIAKDHGVFVSSRQHPQQLKCMLQKPTVETLSNLLTNHFYLTDIGIWLLSDRAVEVLMKKSYGVTNNSQFSTLNSQLTYYDLYSDFGCALGTEPGVDDPEVGALRVAVLPLPGGEFYHFGTSHELLSSTLAVQNLVNDQRQLLHRDRKPHPSIFVQNAETHIAFTPENQNVWIENAYVGENWSITNEHIITGVPENNWKVSLQPGQCLDVIPIGEEQYCIRPYGYHDRFDGEEQQRKQFPVVDAGVFKEFRDIKDILELKEIECCCLLSAEEISAKANLRRLTEQRRLFRAKNWPCLAKNYKHSVFYQIDLEDAAREFAMNQLPVPAELPESEPLLTRIHDAMFRSELARNAGGDTNAGEQKAFSLLREGLTMTALIEKQQPRLSVYSDQIVWGRSPVRIDLAGGWTDTPPYCLMEGGRVLNIAIELNGQPPLQTYVKPCKDYHIVLRSIDLGASEVVKTYEELSDFNHVGSPFSIPKAALVLAGFQPGFSQENFDTLEHQLQAFGCGIEVTLLSAIPAGSGLGTSSLLASTVLGALNDFCGLMWDKNEIGRRTLVLEQLLTTGGGWQDQYGGLLHGVKLLETGRGFEQLPSVRWLPTSIYTQPEYQQCHLLYYTGITRTAKNILSEIVRRMFLNQHDELAILRAMKAHAQEMYEVIQREDFEQMGRLVRKTWMQNQAIDNGTNPPEIQALTELVDDLCLGYKLPGAGGGGYLYMVAKDPEAAARIRQILNTNRKRLNERFVDMTLSMSGLQVSRS